MSDHSKPPQSSGPQTGIEAAAEMLSGLDEAHREKLLQNVAAQDPKLAAELVRLAHRFEHLLQLSPRDFQTWMGDVPRLKLQLALRGADPKVWDFFQSRLSRRAFEDLMEEVTHLGPQRTKDVMAAREELVKIARRLGSEQKIEFKC